MALLPIPLSLNFDQNILLIVLQPMELKFETSVKQFCSEVSYDLNCMLQLCKQDQLLLHQPRLLRAFQMCHKTMAILQCQQSEIEEQEEAMSQTEDGGRTAVRSKAQRVKTR